MGGPLQFQPSPFRDCATILGTKSVQALVQAQTTREHPMQFRVSPKTLEDCSAEEWQARVDLAPAHRLAYMHDFSEGIFNPLTLVAPSRSPRHHQLPSRLHWS